jgi:hypothetical protein
MKNGDEQKAVWFYFVNDVPLFFEKGSSKYFCSGSHLGEFRIKKRLRRDFL